MEFSAEAIVHINDCSSVPYNIKKLAFYLFIGFLVIYFYIFFCESCLHVFQPTAAGTQ